MIFQTIKDLYLHLSFIDEEILTVNRLSIKFEDARYEHELIELDIPSWNISILYQDDGNHVIKFGEKRVINNKDKPNITIVNSEDLTLNKAEFILLKDFLKKRLSDICFKLLFISPKNTLKGKSILLEISRMDMDMDIDTDTLRKCCGGDVYTYTK